MMERNQKQSSQKERMLRKLEKRMEQYYNCLYNDLTLNKK